MSWIFLPRRRSTCVQRSGKLLKNKPKHVTNKDIRYTTTFNRLAGPFWLERLMAAEKDRIIEDERRNILGGP